MTEKQEKPVLDKPKTPQEIRDKARERMKVNGLDDNDIKSIREGRMSDAIKIMKANKAWAEANPNSPLAKYLADMRLQNGEMDAKSAEKAVVKIKELQKKLQVSPDGVVGTGTSMAFSKKLEKEDSDTEKVEAEKLLTDIGSTYTERGIQNLKSGESYRGNDGFTYKKEWDILIRTSKDDKTRRVSTNGWKTWDVEANYVKQRNLPKSIIELKLTDMANDIGVTWLREISNGRYFSLGWKWFQVQSLEKYADGTFQIHAINIADNSERPFSAAYLDSQNIQVFYWKGAMLEKLSPENTAPLA